MDERRKAKRMPVTLSLEILNLYKQDNVQVSNLHAPIEVVNISQTGIGFITESILPLGYYFNANINLGSTDDTLHTVVEIIRCSPEQEKGYLYGAEFVGMANVLSYVFEDYDHKINEEQKK